MCGIIRCLGHNILFVTTLALFNCVTAMAVDLTKNGRTKIHLVVIRIPWDQEFEFSFLLYYSSGTFI